MKQYLLFSILIVLFSSCKKSSFGREENSQKIEKELDKELTLKNIGEKYYLSNCLKCHAGKNAKDNILAYSIRKDKYEFEFLKAYITKQDSLLKNGNARAIAIKENYSPKSNYHHNFTLNNSEIKSIIYYLKQ